MFKLILVMTLLNGQSYEWPQTTFDSAAACFSQAAALQTQWNQRIAGDINSQLKSVVAKCVPAQ